MKAFAALVVSMTVVACSSGPDPDALRRQYEIMKANGAAAAELCPRAREIADAWLAREDQEKYRKARLDADIVCNQALIDDL